MRGTSDNWNDLMAAIEKRVRTPGLPPTAEPYLEPALDPVSVESLEVQEKRLGITFPTLIRRLYTEVGNGGFGPGFGLLSLSPLSDADRPIAYYYLTFREARNRRHAEWAPGVVPICDWGDLILSCLDLTSPLDDPPVVRFEPNLSKDETIRYVGRDRFLGAGLFPEETNLSVWFENWISGTEMFRRPYEQLTARAISEAEAEWREEVGKARRLAEEKGIDQNVIDRAVNAERRSGGSSSIGNPRPE